MAGAKRNRSKATKSQQSRTKGGSRGAHARPRICPVCRCLLSERARADAIYHAGRCRAIGNRSKRLAPLARKLRQREGAKG